MVNLGTTPSIAVVVIHYGPEPHFRRLVEMNVEVLRAQRFGGRIEIVVADDGSPWARSLSSSTTDTVLDREDVKRTALLRDLDVDWFIAGAATQQFRKAALLNLASAQVESDRLVFLDDDSRFRRRDALERFSRYLEAYDLVLGRGQSRAGTYRVYNDGMVSGTNFAVRRSLLQEVGGFGEYTAEWGHGDDVDFFIRVHRALAAKTPKRACFASEILVTRNGPYQRRKMLVPEEQFVEHFRAASTASSPEAGSSGGSPLGSITAPERRAWRSSGIGRGGAWRAGCGARRGRRTPREAADLRFCTLCRLSHPVVLQLCDGPLRSRQLTRRRRALGGAPSP